MIYCDKATKFERINNLFLTLVVNNVKTIRKILSTFFAFSENLNFSYLFPSCRWLLSCSFIFFWLPFAPRNLCQQTDIFVGMLSTCSPCIYNLQNKTRTKGCPIIGTENLFWLRVCFESVQGYSPSKWNEKEYHIGDQICSQVICK